ncbi:MAG: GNAT family N-acetyltransferase, partial [Hyphomicrobiales bacterium]|nr:GNAT family N-acetyltransferase [Hyphomicrobiales bacterium]
LQLDGRPVAMQVVLRAGSAAYTWKTAYDEALGIFSPGMLLFEDYSKAFLADPGITFIDSCACDEASFMAAWRERKLVIDLWFDARGGASAKFAAVARVQKAYLPLRETAKRIYLSVAAIQARVRAPAASWPSMPKRSDKSAPPNDTLARACKT